MVWKKYSLPDSLGYFEQVTSPPREAFERPLPYEVERVYALSGRPIICFASFQNLTPGSVPRILQIHKDVWNTACPPLLVVDSPDGVMVLNAYDRPYRPSLDDEQPEEALQRLILTASGTFRTLAFLHTQGELSAFSRRQIDTGETWRSDTTKNFNTYYRADMVLLRHLRDLRLGLKIGLAGPKLSVSDETIFCAISRLIFIRYLELRNADFRPFTAGESLHDAVLGPNSYAFFERLNVQFNGDMFPAYPEEVKHVTSLHRKFIWDGLTRFDPRTGQGFLFDIDLTRLPIEMLSSIYDEFLGDAERRGSGTYYTSPAVADFVLGESMPLSSGVDFSQWRVLDPACGSGVFLVQAFQRMLRAKATKLGRSVGEAVARELLTRVVGIDKNPIACRIAAFSMNLALLDHRANLGLECLPADGEFRFPKLLGKTILCRDFLNDDNSDLGQFERVVGNPPWGRSPTKKEQQYRQQGWGREEAHYFLLAALDHCSSTGEVAFLSPHKWLGGGGRERFRDHFLERACLRAVVDATALSTSLHGGSRSPTVFVFYGHRTENQEQGFVFASLRPTFSYLKLGVLVLEDTEVHYLRSDELDEQPWLFNVARWGTSRDARFIRAIDQEFPTFQEVVEKWGFTISEGVKRGNQTKTSPPAPGWALKSGAVGATRSPGHFYPYFLPIDEPETFEGALRGGDLEQLDDEPWLKKSAYEDIFRAPFLLCAHSIHESLGHRVHAAIVQNVNVAYRHAFTGVSAKNVTPQQLDMLKWLCTVLNSDLSSYFYFLTSSRWTTDRRNLVSQELLRLPIAEPSGHALKSACSLWARISVHIKSGGAFDDEIGREIQDEMNQLVLAEYGTRPHEAWLISDTVKYKIPYHWWGNRKPESSLSLPLPQALRPASRQDLELYAHAFFWSIDNAVSWRQWRVSATVYQSSAIPSPLVFIKFKIGHLEEAGVSYESFETSTELETFFFSSAHQNDSTELEDSLWRRRHLRVYRTFSDRIDLLIVHPTDLRFWTRSQALMDGDKTVNDLLRWRTAKSDLGS